MIGRRSAMLREMGLAPIWRLRGAADEHETVAPVEQLIDTSVSARAASQIQETHDGTAGHRASLLPDSPPSVAAPKHDSSPSQRAPSHANGAPRILDPARAEKIARLEWDELEDDIRACAACRLCEKRKQAVCGSGDCSADWMLVGEGPGAEEDVRGEPFVGPAGKLLDAMLAAIGLERGRGVYITNAVKCRPPHNRTPEADEISTCLPYLARQIDLVRPRLIIALGRPAANALLNAEISIGASRGKVFVRDETPIIVTYHPAYLLRNAAEKAKVWEDLCFARRVMRERHGSA